MYSSAATILDPSAKKVWERTEKEVVILSTFCHVNFTNGAGDAVWWPTKIVKTMWRTFPIIFSNIKSQLANSTFSMVKRNESGWLDGSFFGFQWQMFPVTTTQLFRGVLMCYYLFCSTKCFPLVTNRVLEVCFHFQMLRDMTVEHIFVRPQTELTIQSGLKLT